MSKMRQLVRVTCACVLVIYAGLGAYARHGVPFWLACVLVIYAGLGASARHGVPFWLGCVLAFVTFVVAMALFIRAADDSDAPRRDR